MNLCGRCPATAPTAEAPPCPILEIAYNKGLDGMQVCEMRDILIAVAKAGTATLAKEDYCDLLAEENQNTVKQREIIIDRHPARLTA